MIARLADNLFRTYPEVAGDWQSQSERAWRG
jgi:hypothetical protein